ncbi:MAG: hypothetical protein LBD17_05040 [Endomicrobium sp.]|jgi:hypothetical protein|nr:hypothetical protein [Endomicrobium sp.]
MKKWMFIFYMALAVSVTSCDGCSKLLKGPEVETPTVSAEKSEVVEPVESEVEIPTVPGGTETGTAIYEQLRRKGLLTPGGSFEQGSFKEYRKATMASDRNARTSMSNQGSYEI